MLGLFVANWHPTLLTQEPVSRSLFLCAHVICSKYARFICWGRDDVILTRRFDYIKELRFLSQSGFFWCYKRLHRLQQGYDASRSVSCATLAGINRTMAIAKGEPRSSHIPYINGPGF